MNNKEEIRAIILAAGRGTRMNSNKAKAAHELLGLPIIIHVANSLNEAGIDSLITVVGYQKESIIEILKDRSKYAIQDEQLGTAHAVMMTEEHLKDELGLTLITVGDMPLVSSNTYANLINKHLAEAADLTVLSTIHPHPNGYGRIVRDEGGNILEIIEDKDCSPNQRTISEINASIYLVDNQKLFESINKIQTDNQQNEFYLTDIVKIFKEKGYIITTYIAKDHLEISGINDQKQLDNMESLLIERKNYSLEKKELG